MDLRLCLFLLATTVAKPQENILPECSLETDGFCDDGQEQTVESVELDQTIPKILLVGPTGSGKSSMANSLLGLDPENEDAMFPVCMDMDSCTKETTYAEGKWLGYGERFIVVDTPGLQDSDGQDNQLIREMVDVLKNKVKTVDCIVLLIEGKTERFHAGLTTQLRQLSTMFGERWWDFLLIGVSKWEYDEKTIIKRERKCVPGKKSCKDEKWFKRNILHQLENKFHQKRSFDFAFIHSYSQIEDNKDDECEQKHWKEETDKLWSFVKSKNSSSFELKGVDDILEDNRRLKRQVNELENTIDTDITYLKGEIQMIKETHDSELNQLKNKTLGEIQTIKETHNSELNQLKDKTLVNKEELTQTMKTNKQELSNTLQTYKQELTTKLQTNKQELDLLLKKETEIQEERRNLNSVFRKDISTNKEEVASLYSKLALMEKDITFLNEGNLNEVFRKDILTNTNEVASLRSKLAVMDKDISTNTNEVASLQTKLAVMDKDISTNTNKVASLQTKLAVMDKDISLLNKGSEDISSNTKEVASLNSKLAVMDKDISANTNEVASLQAELMDNPKLVVMDKDISTNTNEIASLQTKLAVMDKDISKEVVSLNSKSDAMDIIFPSIVSKIRNSVLTRKNCHSSGYVNSLDESFDYKCPTNKVLVKAGSYHSNREEDRRFRFECCDLVLNF